MLDAFGQFTPNNVIETTVVLDILLNAGNNKMKFDFFFLSKINHSLILKRREGQSKCSFVW